MCIVVASHQSQIFPPDNHYTHLVPLRPSSRFAPHPPHHALSFYLKFSALPPPRHPPCLHRFPLQCTVKRYATTSCQQNPSKPLEKTWQTVSPWHSPVLLVSQSPLPYSAKQYRPSLTNTSTRWRPALSQISSSCPLDTCISLTGSLLAHVLPYDDSCITHNLLFHSLVSTQSYIIFMIAHSQIIQVVIVALEKLRNHSTRQ